MKDKKGKEVIIFDNFNSKNLDSFNGYLQEINFYASLNIFFWDINYNISFSFIDKFFDKTIQFLF